MSEAANNLANSLEQYRNYLNVMAKLQIDPRLHGKIDVSGVVQQTLLEAYQALGRSKLPSVNQQAGWLRRILTNNLADEMRKLTTEKRSVGREVPLDAVTGSSSRIQAWQAVDQLSPSQHVQKQEDALKLAEALAKLPEAQREALVLQHWHGWSLTQIAQHLRRSPAAVAGLLKRGLKELRFQLQDNRE
jgi:RNA polymerase sigma-70 factor (ECF subfamily)